MKNKRMYGPDDKMCNLIENDHRVLSIMSCLGIKFGIGDKTIGEVCAETGADTDTFLIIVNTVVNGNELNDLDISSVSIPVLIDGLSDAHRYYLGFRLPEIRENLIRAWGNIENDLLKVMIRYYDEFVESLRKHVALEEKRVFACVRSLAEKGIRSQSCVELQSGSHEPIMARLVELRRLLIRYYPAHDTHRMNDAMSEIQAFESTLRMHCKVEDELLPRIMEKLEDILAEQTVEVT